MTEVGSLLNMVIEVAVFAVVLYLVLRFLRETRGSGVIRGLALLLVSGLVGFWLLIEVLKLQHLGLLFENVVQSVVIAVVVVFHPEIRRAIVRLGDSPIFDRFFKKESKIVQRVLRAIARMSKERIGALIAVERDASLQSLAESGVTIDAELNSFLIESIFYPKSALHDGAIVVRDDRIVAASCLLPLSQNPDVDKRLGTRHRAALGLSEETDALAIVVSEETGKVSAALGGKLSYDLTLEQVERHMEEALGVRQRSAQSERRRRQSFLNTMFSDPLRKLAALLLGIGLFYMLDRKITSEEILTVSLEWVAVGDYSQGGKDQVRVALPTDLVRFVRFENADDGQELEPAQVEITVKGSKDLIIALRAQRGQLTFPVSLPDTDWTRSETAEFTTREIHPTQRVLLGDLSLEMKPRRVRIVTERIKVKDVQPLTLDLVELIGNERLRARLLYEKATFSQDVAQIVGPVAAVDAFPGKTERPFVADLSAQRPHETARHTPPILIFLQPAHRDAGLDIRNHPITLTLGLQPQMQEFELELPIRIDDLSLPPELRGRYQPEQPTLRVKINAGGVLLARLTALEEQQRARFASTSLRLSVYVRPRESYPNELTETARLEAVPPPLGLTGTIEFEPLEVPVLLLRTP